MNFVDWWTTSERGALRLPSIVKESGAALRIFSTVTLPIPNQVGTVSQPNNACAARKPGSMAWCFSTVALQLMSIIDPC